MVSANHTRTLAGNTGSVSSSCQSAFHSSSLSRKLDCARVGMDSRRHPARYIAFFNKNN